MRNIPVARIRHAARNDARALHTVCAWCCQTLSDTGPRRAEAVENYGMCRPCLSLALRRLAGPREREARASRASAS